VDAATSLKRLLAVMEQQGEVAEMAMLRLESLETTRWLVATQRCGGRGVTQPRAAGAGGDMHVHEAVKLRREALATLQQLHGGVNDSDVAAAMDSLARAVFSSPTADVAEVCVLHRESLSMVSRLHGADAEDGAMTQSLGHLGAVMSLRGDSSEALGVHRESLAMTRRVQGASVDVAAVAASLSTVAEALHAKQQVAESVVTPPRGGRNGAAINHARTACGVGTWCRAPASCVKGEAVRGAAGDAALSATPTTLTSRRRCSALLWCAGVVARRTTPTV
jgi:hypothetical protein